MGLLRKPSAGARRPSGPTTASYTTTCDAGVETSIVDKMRNDIDPDAAVQLGPRAYAGVPAPSLHMGETVLIWAARAIETLAREVQGEDTVHVLIAPPGA